jgi:protein-tyrosine-phosphatase
VWLARRVGRGHHRGLVGWKIRSPSRDAGTDSGTERLSDELAERADVVVTMGCGDACPFIPGKRYLDWELPDPAGRPVDEVRVLRDDIVRRVRELVDELDRVAS